MHMYTCVFVFMSVGALRHQRTTSGVVPQMPSTLFFETESVISLELAQQAEMAGP